MAIPRAAAFAAVVLLGLAWSSHGEDKPAPFEEAVLKEAGLPSDGLALLEFFRKRTLSEVEQAKIADTVRRLGDRSFSVREDATAELIALGRMTRPYLKPALTSRDPEVVRRVERCLSAIELSGTALPVAAARLLAVRRPEGAAAVVLNFLPFADDEFLEDELLTTLTALGIRAGKPEAALIAALKDRVPLRRGAAAIILGRLEDQRVAVRPLLADPDMKVRLRAAEGLLRGKDREAVPVLIALLNEAPLPVAWPAEELLCRIAGDKAPQVWVRASDDAERRKCRDAWTAWWGTHGAKLDLTKLELEAQPLGLTLVCACDGYNQGKGKVWEIGPDGKARWEIDTANYPVDAQMLPGNRVLIAEQSGRKVTERDLTGKVLWEHAVNDSLVACQRLPGGNTFIATYTKVIEVTPSNKEVYSYPAPGGSIYAAHKLRNGHIACLSSNGVFTELDERGKDVKTMRLDPASVGLVKFEVLPGGRYLIGQLNRVAELDGEGKVVWECPMANANSVQRLPSGNTLVCLYPGRRVVEVDRTGKTVWEQKLEGGPLRTTRR